MVKLTLTVTAKAAIDYFRQHYHLLPEDEEIDLKLLAATLSVLEIGDAVDHHDFINLSTCLVKGNEGDEKSMNSERWRLDALLRGARVYQPPPLPKPEPSSEYKALMKRLREEEERRQYERMLNPPAQPETFQQRFPGSKFAVNQPIMIGSSDVQDEVDEVTYADVNRQMVLIMNVLVSIICCSVAIWMAARRWSVPQRLGLSMFGSCLVAFAEVAIYMGYIRRIKEAKVTERKKAETKEVVETWVIDGNSKPAKAQVNDESIRYRKGKHR